MQLQTYVSLQSSLHFLGASRAFSPKVYNLNMLHAAFIVVAGPMQLQVIVGDKSCFNQWKTMYSFMLPALDAAHAQGVVRK